MATIMAQPQLLTQLMRELRALRCASWCRPSRRRRRGCGSIVDDASDWIAMLIALHLPAADAMPQIHVPAFDAVHLSAIDVVPQHILCFDPVGHEHYHKDTDAQAALTLAVGGTAAIVGVVLRYFIDTDDGGGASKCYGRADRSDAPWCIRRCRSCSRRCPRSRAAATRSYRSQCTMQEAWSAPTTGASS